MPPLPLNPDGTINVARANYEYFRDEADRGAAESKSKKKTVANADVSDLNEKIKDLEDLYKEASGFKKKELKARIEEAKADREARIEAAKISADASKYGSDKSLEGTKYGSDAGERNSQRSADASRFSAQLGLQGTQYSSDAGERNSQRGADATRYGADQSAASSRYGTDADLYKFAAEQPNKRAQTALSFLNTYSQMAQTPANFLQASQYARLGRQVEGMPGMINDLLGEVNPNATPAGGNMAFRTGTADMPQNAAMSAYGANPLGLVSTRSANPGMPVWTGGQQSSYSPPVVNYGTNDLTALNSVGSELEAAVNSGQLDPSAAGAQWQQAISQYKSANSGEGNFQMMGRPDVVNTGLTQGQGYPSMMSQAFAPVNSYGGSYTANGEYIPPAHRGRLVNGGVATSSYGAAAGMPASMTNVNSPYRAGAYNEAAPAQVQGNPTILDGGRLVADYDPTEEAFKGGVRTLMQRGAHRWGNQALERMSTTERGMLESGIKDAGGVPSDYFESYARSRIGNEGAGRAL